MSLENYKLLVRNLRKKGHEELKIQASSSSVRYNKVRESVHIPRQVQPDNRKK